MPEQTPEERTAEANAKQAEAAARQAEAAARQAEAAAAKAEQEQAERESELAKQAREAARRRDIAEADQKARGVDQSLSDELTQQKLDADARKAIAEAEKAAADAERAQVSALIPDFSKIEKGATTVKGDQAVFGSLLGRMALDGAAKKVVEQLSVAKHDHVLITTETDLASTDVVYLEVVTGLDTLTDSANDLHALFAKEPVQPVPDRAMALTTGSVVGAIASAAPGLLSLFSANRTLSSRALTADTRAAVAAVASRLAANAKVQIDDFRITEGGRVAAKEKALRQARSRLIERKLELEEDKTQAGRQSKAALAEIAELNKKLAGLAGDDPKKSHIEKEVALQQQAVGQAEDQERKASVAIARVVETVTGIDAFVGALHTTPPGGTRSPFAIAVLRQQLRPSDKGDGAPIPFTKVLFIEASAGAVDQVLNDRPLWFKDKLHSIGSVAITYWLMGTTTSDIEASGVASGLAEIRVEIGNKLELIADVTT